MSGNSRVYLDISIEGDKIGRVVCELFGDKAPKAAKNFYHLCLGDRSVEGSETLSYKGNYFHRVIKNFMIQGGDIVNCSAKFLKSDEAGRGGCSIYATKEELASQMDDTEVTSYGNFEDENLGEFPEAFVLAMANSGSPDTNGSQFFITTFPAPHLNGKHTIFGRVIHGKSVIRTAERCKIDSDGFPSSCIRIDDCGEWDESKDVPLYNGSNDTIGGDTFEEYPDDEKSIGSEDFSAAYNAANTIKESGTLIFKKKDFKNAVFKYVKSLRYVNEYVPDEDVDKDNNFKFVTLKMKLYLNLSLALYNMQNYDGAIEYASFLLEMENVPDVDQAKAYYRRGNSYLSKKNMEKALQNFELCKDKNPDDPSVTQRIDYVNDILEKRKEKTKRSLSKFFSGSS